jgi:ubiquinone/menaquinone biosynthesis C-methylase UbiE
MATDPHARPFSYHDPRLPAHPDNTYVIGIQHMNSELARLLGQERMINDYMPLVPPGVKLPADAQVLDIACGPGGWACEFAFTFPEARVVGVDINEQYITYAQATAQVQGLENVTFQVMNVVAGFQDEEASPHSLEFADQRFDLVNARFLVGFLKESWWPRLIREMMRVTKPGGIIRLTECNGLDIVTNSLALERYREILAQTLRRNGRLAVVTPLLKPWLVAAGCTNVQTAPYLIDYQAGSVEHTTIYRNHEIVLYEFIDFITRVDPSHSREEMEALYQQCLIEMSSQSFCGQLLFVSAWGSTPG